MHQRQYIRLENSRGRSHHGLQKGRRSRLASLQLPTQTARALTSCPNEQQGTHIQCKVFDCLVAENTSNHARCMWPHVDNDKMPIKHPPSWRYLPQNIDAQVYTSYGYGCGSCRRYIWPHAILLQRRFIIVGEEIANTDGKQSCSQRGKNSLCLPAS